MRFRVVRLSELEDHRGSLSAREYLPDVRIEGDRISLYDEDGKEVVGWVSDEWVEDPDVVYAIVNAVRIAYERGVSYVAELIRP